MCLDFSSKKVPEITNFGWKIFIRQGSIYTPYIQYQPEMKAGIWYEDEAEGTIKYGFLRDEFRYEKGFHFFTNEWDATFEKNWVSAWRNTNRLIVKKVEIEKIIVYGIEDDKLIGVAKRIKICA